jgi:hypothetical protein
MKKMKKKLGFSEWERFVKLTDIKSDEFTNLQLNGFIKFVQFKICSKSKKFKIKIIKKMKVLKSKIVHIQKCSNLKMFKSKNVLS